MNYHMDSYFAIGKQHANEGKPCQDYAIARVEGDTAIAVVSDGCSTGGMTDVGARIVAHSILSEAKHQQSFDFLCLKNRHSLPTQLMTPRYCIFDSASGLSLKEEDLYSTSLLIRACEGSLKVHILGDGVVAHKFHDGSIWARRYEWDKGVPYYPVYEPQKFVDQVCDGHWDLLSCTSQDFRYSPVSKEWSFLEEKSLTAREGIQGFLPRLYHPDRSSLSFNDEFIAIFSDGVTQIKDVDWKDAVFQFLDFKNTTGQFVKRRMMKALKIMTPLDDISCAVLRISADADNDNDAIDA